VHRPLFPLSFFPRTKSGVRELFSILNILILPFLPSLYSKREKAIFFLFSLFSHRVGFEIPLSHHRTVMPFSFPHGVKRVGLPLPISGLQAKGSPSSHSAALVHPVFFFFLPSVGLGVIKRGPPFSSPPRDPSLSSGDSTHIPPGRHLTFFLSFTMGEIEKTPLRLFRMPRNSLPLPSELFSPFSLSLFGKGRELFCLLGTTADTLSMVV